MTRFIRVRRENYSGSKNAKLATQKKHLFVLIPTSSFRVTEILTFPALGFKAYRTISCQSLNLVDKKICSEILAILFASSKLTKSLGLDINQRVNYLSDFSFLLTF